MSPSQNLVTVDIRANPERIDQLTGGEVVPWKARRTRKDSPDSSGLELTALLQEVAIGPEGHQAASFTGTCRYGLAQ